MIRAVLLIVVSACLVACGSTSTTTPSASTISNTQAEGDIVYNSKIPLWLPQPILTDEPLWQYGNAKYMAGPASFRPWYQVKAYQADGFAEIRDTQRRPLTITGETFDSSELIASHPYLPLPSYIKVKNLINDEQTVLRVVDRGPFFTGSLISVSMAAAQRLGFGDVGPYPVRIELVRGESPRFTLETNYVYGNAAALQIMANLSNLELGHIQPVVVPHQYDNRYRVILRPFASIEDAQYVSSWLNDNYNVQSSIVRD